MRWRHNDARYMVGSRWVGVTAVERHEMVTEALRVKVPVRPTLVDVEGEHEKSDTDVHDRRDVGGRPSVR